MKSLLISLLLVTAPPDTAWKYTDTTAVYEIREAVVTATENHGLTSASKIGKDAIAHIQPSSIADLLELLPGGIARDPAFGSPQAVNLRAAGSLNANYATQALGTRFTIDGKPILNDANLQFTPAYSNLGADNVNMGTDMRTLSTEEIESLDVVRGIASVEHGDLTSGLIQIKRRRGGRDLHLRFKSDMKSKLMYAGKGFEWGGDEKRTANIGLNFLDSKADPRNLRQNYKRLTGSLRGSRTWQENGHYSKILTANLDYTGSFDTQKSDKDLDEFDGIPAETYRSSYHHIDLGADFTLRAKSAEKVLKSIVFTAQLSYGMDRIERFKHVILSAEEPISISREPGETDAYLLPSRYDATLTVDGKPFYAYLRAVSRFRVLGQNLMAGAEWTLDKNFGGGSVFDVTRPLNPGMGTRPRPYYEIPAESTLAVFAEENGRGKIGTFGLEWQLGLRASTRHGMHALDPRGNIRLNFPTLMPGGYRLEAGIYGGAGLHTKFPTMDMLYPALMYGDKIQLNYWPAERALRRVNFLVYTIDATPHDLAPARNFKWEIGADASWNGWSASVDFFTEDMRSGFRNGSDYIRLISKDYDESSIDKSALTGPPSTETIPYVPDTTLVAYALQTNGSRSLKRGVEFTLSSARIPVINTRVHINGAWFRTRYMNSQPEWERPSVMLNGKSYPYIGLYDKNDSRLYDSFTSSFLLDTQVPSLGLIFSTSFQCIWFTAQQFMADDSTPVAYLDKDLVRHPYTEESAADGVLRQLKRQYASALLQYTVTPFSMHVNLKVSKTLFRGKATAALFVNRLFTLAPDYYIDGVLKRRSSVPYFGMELSMKI